LIEKGNLKIFLPGLPFHEAIISSPIFILIDKLLCDRTGGTWSRNSPFFSKE
jgi:hypothetical protein